MNKGEMFKELSDAVISCKKDVVEATVKKARGEGIEPAEIIKNGLSVGMKEVGILFEKDVLFLPHVMLAAAAMQGGVVLLDVDMPKEAISKKLDVIVNSTVERDVYDIGRSIVSTMLQASGSEVNDVGRTVPHQNFIDIK
jgi:dimethylamine corrinoid protein